MTAGLPRLLRDGTARYLYGPGGRLLEQIRADGAVFYYEQDQLGSVVRLSPAAGGGAISYTYDAYGTRTATNPTGITASQVFGYAGEYTDAESGLIYLRARYYDPASQQFLTRDPLAAFSETPYSYAGGSPVNATDPSGLIVDTVLDVGFVLWDVGDLISSPSWDKAGWLAADVGLMLLPGAPAGAGLAGRAGRAGSRAERVAARAAWEGAVSSGLPAFRRGNFNARNLTPDMDDLLHDPAGLSMSLTTPVKDSVIFEGGVQQLRDLGFRVVHDPTPADSLHFVLRPARGQGAYLKTCANSHAGVINGDPETYHPLTMKLLEAGKKWKAPR